MAHMRSRISAADMSAGAEIADNDDEVGNQKGMDFAKQATAEAPLWRALFERYRFGRLSPLSPAPLMYIQMVLRKRCKERTFARTLASHVVFVSLIVAVIFLQRPVADVYNMQRSISGLYEEFKVYEPNKGQHVTLESIRSLEDVWVWMSDAMLPVMLTNAETLNDGRIVVRMYNQ